MNDQENHDVDILDEVYTERQRQDAQWGEQNHPDGTGGREFEIMRDHARQRCQESAAGGTVTWEHVATEEYFEALAETDETRLREELIQLQAVLCNWVGAIDRRRGR